MVKAQKRNKDYSLDEVAAIAIAFIREHRLKGSQYLHVMASGFNKELWEKFPGIDIIWYTDQMVEKEILARVPGRGAPLVAVFEDLSDRQRENARQKREEYRQRLGEDELEKKESPTSKGEHAGDSQSSNPEYISLADMALRFECCYETLRKLFHRHKNKIPHRKEGRLFFVSEESEAIFRQLREKRSSAKVSSHVGSGQKTRGLKQRVAALEDELDFVKGQLTRLIEELGGI